MTSLSKNLQWLLEVRIEVKKRKVKRESEIGRIALGIEEEGICCQNSFLACKGLGMTLRLEYWSIQHLKGFLDGSDGKEFA